MTRLAVIAAVMIWLAGGGATAQDGPTPVTRPLWIEVPPIAQLPQSASNDSPAELTLNCVVSGETLAGCAAAEPAPRPLLNAALAAAAAARIDAQDGAGAATEGRPITIGIAFSADAPAPQPATTRVAATTPAPPQAAGETLTGVVWAQRPSARDYGLAYPNRAMQRGIAGRVVLDCVVGEGGRLTCTIASEEPAGQGFGAASLEVAEKFRAAAQTRDGAPTAGGRVRVPIRWAIAG